MLIKDKSLTPHAIQVIRHQMTEKPCADSKIGHEAGTYLCRACGLALFRTQMQFHSFCGWPSFDETIKNAIKTHPDPDGIRTEIICAGCHAHLGHFFDGEGFTAKNKRYCVNSVSLDFSSHTDVLDTEEAILAGGCFWGVEYYFNQLPGVVKTEVGYLGGLTVEPTYEQVCTGATGHLEALRVVYDCKQLDYQTVIQYFFEIHDPTQVGGQGPDIGPQYQSAIFYHDQIQHQMAQSIIERLKKNGYPVVTALRPMDIFWRAETYHQHYYSKNKSLPYCHRWVKRF